MAGRPLVAVIAAAAALAGCDAATDDDGAPTSMAISDAWAPSTVSAATTGAVYGVVQSPRDDALVGATVDPDVAGGVTLHVTETDAGTGMVTMSGLDELALPAGDDVVLEPGGTHLMLTDLASPLAAGTTFEITLQFATADDLTVTVKVRRGDD